MKIGSYTRICKGNGKEKITMVRFIYKENAIKKLLQDILHNGIKEEEQ